MTTEKGKSKRSVVAFLKTQNLRTGFYFLFYYNL